MGLFGIAVLRFAILQQMTVDTIFILLPIKTEMKSTAKLRSLALIEGMRNKNFMLRYLRYRIHLVAF